MQGHPNNPGNNPNNNSYSNIGSYSSLGDAPAPSYTQNTRQQQQQSNQSSYSSLGDTPNPFYSRRNSQHYESSYYSGFGEGQGYSGWGSNFHDDLAGGSNYVAASNPGNICDQKQYAVNWVVEQPQQSGKEYGETGNFARDQQPVTWVMEQSNQQYQHSSQQLQPPQQNIYGPNRSMSQQMQYSRQQPSNSYHNIPYANNPYPPHQPSNNLYSQMPLAIPPPPPPPPPMPSKANQDSSRHPLPPPSKDPPKEVDDGAKHPGPTKSKRGEEMIGQSWGKPPSARQQGGTIQSAHQQQPESQKDNSQKNIASVNNAKEDLPAPKKPWGEAIKFNNPTHPPKMNETVDANLSAINALSFLETKWAAPPSKPLSKNQKRQRRRNKNKQTKDHQDEPSGSGTAHDAVDLIGEWVNVDHSESKESNLRLKTAEELKHPSNPKSSNNAVIELTDDTREFPPLSGNQNVSGNVAAVGNYISVPLEQMSKSQLKSYAAVLSRAIDESKPAAAVDRAQEARSSLEDEMDISDDENEGAGNNKQTANISYDSMAKKLQDISSEVSYADSNESIQLNATANTIDEPVLATPTSEKASRLHDEREKCRLRLEELRAKAKLANAKLKLAKKKRALENNTPPPMQGRGDNRRSSTENVNDLKFDEGSSLKRPRSLDKPSIPDLTALRKSLVVEVGLFADAGDQTNLRFVDSVNEDTSEDETDYLCESSMSLVQEVKPAVPDPESSRKASELKQKLHLAKLRLELKKKELELKRKKSTAAVVPKNEDNLGEAEVKTTGQSSSVPKLSLGSEVTTGMMEKNPFADSHLPKDECVNAMSASCGDDKIDNSALSLEQKAAQIEELKRRQKELVQSNEVSNLKNLIQRQREILRVKGLELTDSSTQLQTCVKEIKSKQQDLAASEKRVEEMNHRKRIMEGMILRATEKLMTARRNLRERQVQEANATKLGP